MVLIEYVAIPDGSLVWTRQLVGRVCLLAAVLYLNGYLAGEESRCFVVVCTISDSGRRELK